MEREFDWQLTRLGNCPRDRSYSLRFLGCEKSYHKNHFYGFFSEEPARAFAERWVMMRDKLGCCPCTEIGEPFRSFGDALAHVRAGGMARRDKWEDGYYLIIENGDDECSENVGVSCLDNGELHGWRPATSDDQAAMDWLLVGAV